MGRNKKALDEKAKFGNQEIADVIEKKKIMSGKIKKAMMKAERRRKRENMGDDVYVKEKSEDHMLLKKDDGIVKLQSRDLRTVFSKESKVEIEKRKFLSTLPYVKLDLGSYNFCLDDVSCDFRSLDIPKRPYWDHNTTPQQLQINEKIYFEEYLEKLYETYGQECLNKFEHNLEVWRQLWRVIERCDILLLLVDIRFPRVNFHQSFYYYISNILRKPVVLVLTKIDLVPFPLILAWKEWFTVHYPGLVVIPFSSHPLPIYSTSYDADPHIKRIKRRLKGVRLPQPSGGETLLQALRSIVLDGKTSEEICFNNIKTSLTADMSQYGSDLEMAGQETSNCEGNDGTSTGSDDESYSEEEDNKCTKEQVPDNVASLCPYFVSVMEEEKESAGIGPSTSMITIGIVGSPNAGKSSLTNSLTGRKVVSVSRTPGHTKHLQTIIINRNTCLCDCPGLVMPAVNMPLPLQILGGHINIAQVRETYSTLAFVGARIPLEKIYNLKPPLISSDQSEKQPFEVRQDQLLKSENNEARKEAVSAFQWSGYSITEAWAAQKGYYIYGNKLDTHRAGNEILRDIVSGRVVCAVAPPLSTSEFSDFPTV